MSKQVLSFEESVKRLEEIVGALEKQTSMLDESLRMFEEGVGLVKECQRMLDEAEQKVKILTRNEEGAVVEEDFLDEAKKG